MTRVQLGSKWKEAPLIVRLLRVLPSDGAVRECSDYEERQRQTDHDWILQPPAPRGYGYASYGDLASLGYDPEQDRHNDLKRWAHDLDLAVEAGLITQHEGEAAWASATKNQNSSTSSTGTSSTTAPTPMKNRSSKDSPFVVAGQRSLPRRKKGNRPSSLPSRWQPRGPA